MTSWTLPELAARASEALAAEPGRVNGRVQEVPNERLIRWYTTIGLVDPPLSRRGRIALYGTRHLLQIVAVKRRQAAGLTIAEIQAELAGAPDTVLQEISGIDAAAPVQPPTRNRFWATSQSTSEAIDPALQPDPPVPPALRTDFVFRPEGEVELSEPQPAGSPHAFAVQGLRLADGVTLLLEGAAFTADDLTALAAAAQPLLDEIISRRTESRRSS
jgi:DNA-binding transcriptional MerR regulator